MSEYIPSKSDILESGINCRTIEEAEILLDWAVNNGHKWVHGSITGESTYWWKNQSTTCYRIQYRSNNIAYNSSDGFKGSGIAVFSFDMAVKVLGLKAPSGVATDEYVFIASSSFTELNNRVKKFKEVNPNYSETQFVQYQGDADFFICFRRDEDEIKEKDFCEVK